MVKIAHSEARELLGGFDHADSVLAADYLNKALDRLLVTLGLVPELRDGARVLELGAYPYFMTSLLLHHFPHCEVQPANEPDWLKVDGGRAKLINRRRGVEYSFEYQAFNVETDRFPYEDGRFDVVLYCELIEHLMHDPTQSLYEIHRVLKPEGHMVLSTPNPFRWENFLKILGGRNIYPPFSGYGPYARHNREFSAAELRLLLKQCNFEIETMVTAYDPAYQHPGRMDWLVRTLGRAGLLPKLMDVIHLRARAVGKPIYRYPPELYLDVSRYQRIVNDNIEMGANDEAQLGEGFYQLEYWPPHVRWTERMARARLVAGGHTALGIRFFSGPKKLGRQVAGTITVGGCANRFEVKAGEWVELRFPLQGAENGCLEMELELDQAWVPKAVLGSSDTRNLGVAVQRIWLE